MITIRTYTPQDTLVLEKLATDFQRYYVSIDSTRSIAPSEFGRVKVREMLENVEEKDGEIFLACDGEVVIGFAACVVDKRAESEEIERPLLTAGTLKELFIAEKYRGEGVGKQLLERAEKFFRDKGCKRMWMCVIAENIKAKEFYESHGYAVGEYELVKDL